MQATCMGVGLRIASAERESTSQRLTPRVAKSLITVVVSEVKVLARIFWTRDKSKKNVAYPHGRALGLRATEKLDSCFTFISAVNGASRLVCQYSVLSTKMLSIGVKPFGRKERLVQYIDSPRV